MPSEVTGPSPVASGPLLEVRDLSVHSRDFAPDIVGGISFTVSRGEILALVGESGSGKTTVALALLGYARPGTSITHGDVLLGGTNLLGISDRELRHLRGRDIAFVPQDPATGLSPGMRVGRQVGEMIRAHFPGDGATGERVARAFRLAELPSDREFLRRYPHQLSGGQQQRVAIAMALACDPAVLVFDEPTTGLDVTTQSRLLETIRELVVEGGVAGVYVSHDLGVVRNLASRVAVMYGGRLLEEASVDDLFEEPRHPYTRRLLEAVPRINGAWARPRGIPGVAVEPWKRPPGCPFAPRCGLKTSQCETEMPPIEVADGRSIRCWNWRDTPLDAGGARLSARPGASGSGALPAAAPALEVVGLRASYPRPRGFNLAAQADAPAIADISFRVPAASCVGIVGESGSGKTTLLRALCGLHAPDAGEMRLNGTVFAPTARQRSQSVRRAIQLVPQNPDSSLNPRHDVGTIVARPLRLFFGSRGGAQRTAVGELLERVQLRPSMATRYPRELSGGEKQRVAIARALAARPELLLCDEITASLDVAVQAEILNLIEELRQMLNMTVVFVSHDLAVVRAISDEVIVMSNGRIQEVAPVATIFTSPADSYTRDLLAAIPAFKANDYPGATITDHDEQQRR